MQAQLVSFDVILFTVLYSNLLGNYKLNNKCHKLDPLPNYSAEGKGFYF